MPLKQNDARTLASWRPHLLEFSIDATNIANSLFVDEILQKPHMDKINAKETDDDKMILLISMYEQRANDLEPLNRALRKFRHKSVINDVNLVLADEAMVKHIQARLRRMCQNVAKAWGELLKETSVEKCFVEPEIVEWKKKEREERAEEGKSERVETGKTVTSYEQLFNSKDFRERIVIEGDPGMGKTTYVNKLALDWESDEENETGRFLQSKFSVVFLIPLQSLNASKSTTLAQAADIQLRNCGSWLHAKFENCPKDCLLILDAFDEYDGSCRDINDIIAGTLFPQLKVIITTRPSHIRRLETGPQWLSITGLTTKEKRELFLVKQGWDKLLERDMINHVLSGFCPLWNTPLYLAMLCVLYKAKKVTKFNPSHPSRFHVLVKSFTEYIMSRCVNEKGFIKLNREERLELKSCLQQRAYQEFSENNPWLNPVLSQATVDRRLRKKPRIEEGSLTISQDVTKLAGQIGLVIIQEKRNPATGENVEIVTFIHRIFVEYYAAIEFGSTFNIRTKKKVLVQKIKENLGLPKSPFSYFLAAECESYKQMLIKKQSDCCESDNVKISEFPWIPVIKISDDVFKAFQNTSHMCGLIAVSKLSRVSGMSIMSRKYVPL